MTTTPMNSPQAAATAAQRVNVYELFLDNEQMPQDDLGAVHYKQGYLDAFFQDSVPDREERRKITTFMQKAVNNEYWRVSIFIPEDELQAAHDRITLNGSPVVFQDLAEPMLEPDQFTLPAAFQLKHCGCILDPRSLQDHPGRMELLSRIVANEIPDLPEEAADWQNWTSFESSAEEDFKDRMGLFTIRWEQRQP